ncbi:hypothetical protein ACIQRW_01380 [Streptomyces sp. NPDC091287]|uniref:hypothetical protein n=1 Tax=Streptomyces sp. NPDC091287 TaxID=3365988 RepID=UPI0038257A4F
MSEVDSLAIWLDRESKDEEDLEAERDAATALTAGEYPPPATESGDEEEKDDDEAGHGEEWERYDRARNFRSRHHEHWRRLHSYRTRSNEAVSEYPFFAPWADGLQSRLATVLDEERRAFAALVQPIRLLEAAVVRIPPEAKVSADPGLAGLGAEAGEDLPASMVRVESASHLILAPPGRSGLLGLHRRQRRLRTSP